MYSIQSLVLDQDVLARGGPTIATKIKASHPFRDGHTVQDEIIGRRVTVVFPAADYQTLDVKVADPTDALTVLLNKGNPVYVVFDGFEGRAYDFKDNTTGVRRTGISAKADAVRVVPGPTVIEVE